MSDAVLVRTLAPGEDRVGIIEIMGGPESYLTVFVLWDLIKAMTILDEDPDCGAIVVRSQGKHFCAGRDWGTVRDPLDTADAIYTSAPQFLGFSTPWIAELTGGSIGVGMGLALCADYRVAADTAYLCAKFVKVGIHHGFGLSATLPWLVGKQRATEIVSTGRRLSTPEALRIGLIDEVAPLGTVTEAARAFAATLAALPAQALASIKGTMRAELIESFTSAIVRERAAQKALYDTTEFQSATGGGYRYNVS